MNASQIPEDVQKQVLDIQRTYTIKDAYGTGPLTSTRLMYFESSRTEFSLKEMLDSPGIHVVYKDKGNMPLVTFSSLIPIPQSPGILVYESGRRRGKDGYVRLEINYDPANLSKTVRVEIMQYSKSGMLLRRVTAEGPTPQEKPKPEPQEDGQSQDTAQNQNARPDSSASLDDKVPLADLKLLLKTKRILRIVGSDLVHTHAGDMYRIEDGDLFVSRQDPRAGLSFLEIIKKDALWSIINPRTGEEVWNYRLRGDVWRLTFNKIHKNKARLEFTRKPGPTGRKLSLDIDLNKKDGEFEVNSVTIKLMNKDQNTLFTIVLSEIHPSKSDAQAEKD